MAHLSKVAPIWWFTTIYNSRSKKSTAFFCIAFLFQDDPAIKMLCLTNAGTFCFHHLLPRCRESREKQKHGSHTETTHICAGKKDSYIQNKNQINLKTKQNKQTQKPHGVLIKTKNKENNNNNKNLPHKLLLLLHLFISLIRINWSLLHAA